jgi:NAD(P)H-dependent FMN reductase
MPPRLQIFTVSTRPGRKGPLVTAWFEEQARAHGRFDVELVDLADVNLPLMDEPEHPRLRRYQHEHTRAWSASVEKADAFVFVTPEYNFSTPPPLLNALDYLVHEWAYKPAGFVSYGGVSGGLRATQMTKLVLTSFKIVPMLEAVAIPLFANYIDSATGVFSPGDVQAKAAVLMLDELLRWSHALKVLRAPVSA